MPNLNSLFQHSKKHIKSASLVLARAFQNDPVAVWQVPDESERISKYHHIWRVLLCIGVKHGEVYATSENFEGIAMWVPPDIVDVSFWRLIKCGVLKLPFKFGLRCIKRMLHVQRFMDSTRKKYINPPYWHFGPIGVDPVFQGKGFASKLLRPMLARIDEEDLLIYLETNLEKNAQLYQHFGFEVVEEKVIPKTNVTNWAMIRNKFSSRIT